jgi:hypothetical protein
VARVRGGLLCYAAADDAAATGASCASVSSTKRLLRRIGLVRPAALASGGRQSRGLAWSIGNRREHRQSGGSRTV